MNDTFRKLQSFGCSLRGIQSILRRNEYEYGDDCPSDADWGSFYYPVCDEQICEHGIHINCLPKEILLKIFSFLSARCVSQSVLPVCKYWHKLGRDPVLWKRLEFIHHSENSYAMMIKTCSLKYEFMRSISLKNFRSSQQMERMLWHIGNNCSRLQEVHLYNCSLRSETLTRLGMTCPNIRSLSLVRCDENYRKNHYLWAYMKDASFVVSFPKLTSLVLFRTLATLSYDDAQNIVRVCKNLKKLVLDCDFWGRAIRLIIASLRNSIEVLWLQGRNYNDSMCQEISKCQKLRELGLNHVENITPFGLKYIGSLKKLEKLLLFHATNISPLCFAEFFKTNQFHNLSYVNLSGCRGVDAQVKTVIRAHCPRIREVIFEVQGIRKEPTYIDFDIYINHPE